MNMDMYDEFGNPIEEEGDWEAGEVEEDEEDGEVEDRSESVKESPRESEEEPLHPTEAVVLHEDKKYYAEAEEVYPSAEVLVMEEDAQPLTEPVVPPVQKKSFNLISGSIPRCNFDFNYLGGLSQKEKLLRNVAVVGHLHHGKTSFLDMLVEGCQEDKWDPALEVHFTDTRSDEQQRKISIKASPITLLLQDSRSKSYVLNLVDCPGHSNFWDEAVVGMRLADGIILLVDIVEGIMLNTERAIKHAINEELDIILVLNKMDRLVVELRLPPNDAYHKIKYVCEQVNDLLQTYAPEKYKQKERLLTPVNGNVLFASSKFSCVFTLLSFAQMYAQRHNIARERVPLLVSSFWGDIYYNPNTRTFQKKPPHSESKRAFVQFLLEPFYKIVGHTISEEKKDLAPILKHLGIFLNKKYFRMDTKPLLKIVLSRVFGDLCSLTDSIVKFIQNAGDGNRRMVRKYYMGSTEEELTRGKEGPLFVHIGKLLNSPDCKGFEAWGRVISGTLSETQQVLVLGEGYNEEEQEDLVQKSVSGLWIPEGRYRVRTQWAGPGCWVLIGGVDESISKTATLLSTSGPPLQIMRPMFLGLHDACIKLACEPLNPSELPKMLEGLRKINKSYAISHTRVEESGEHTLMGTGELYLDCILHDLRRIYSEIEIKVSDPSVSFSETVIDTSGIKCVGETNNKKNKLVMIAEPLDKEMCIDIETDLFRQDALDQGGPQNLLQTKYGWDILTANSFWAFGPTNRGPNLLVDYTLPSEIDKSLLHTVKHSIVQGFQWAAKEGPLCEEPIRGVKFKILDANISTESVYRAGGQIIPAARRVSYSAFLMGTPRIMEPILEAEISCPSDCIAAIYTVLFRRRGHVTSELQVPGTPLYTIRAHLPALDSFGFETDLRTHTAGQAFVLTMFHHWEIAPGDPLDKSVQLKILEPSLPPQLAREMMVKTRRRKGLLEDVSIAKFFDDPGVVTLLRQEPAMKNYF